MSTYVHGSFVSEQQGKRKAKKNRPEGRWVKLASLDVGRALARRDSLKTDLQPDMSA